MAVQKPIRFLYQAKSNITGLTDVKAQIYVNGTAKAVSAAAIGATANANGSKVAEIDSVNSPGIYEILLSSADLTAWGVVAGAYSALEARVNSVSQSAPAAFRQEETVANLDDLDSHLTLQDTAIAAISTKIGTPAGASVSADILSVKSDTSAIKADLETGSASLATILANLQALQNGSISNGVGYVLPSMLIPASGSNTYRIPITIMDNEGRLIDPATNLVTVGVLNAAGTDRGSFLTGSSGSPATVSAVRDSLGQYHAMVSIPSTAIEEELIYSFSYAIGVNAMVRYGQSQLLTDTGASGYALQSTLLSVQSTVTSTNGVVTNGTFGNSALQALLSNGTYGLSALQALLGNGTYGLSALQAILSNATYGNAALQALLSNGTYGLSAIQATEAATQGTGFAPGSDDLHSLSVYLRANSYQGGKAI